MERKARNIYTLFSVIVLVHCLVTLVSGRILCCIFQHHCQLAECSQPWRTPLTPDTLTTSPCYILLDPLGNIHRSRYIDCYTSATEIQQVWINAKPHFAGKSGKPMTTCSSRLSAGPTIWCNLVIRDSVLFKGWRHADPLMGRLMLYLCNEIYNSMMKYDIELFMNYDGTMKYSYEIMRRLMLYLCNVIYNSMVKHDNELFMNYNAYILLHRSTIYYLAKNSSICEPIMIPSICINVSHRIYLRVSIFSLVCSINMQDVLFTPRWSCLCITMSFVCFIYSAGGWSPLRYYQWSRVMNSYTLPAPAIWYLRLYYLYISRWCYTSIALSLVRSLCCAGGWSPFLLYQWSRVRSSCTVPAPALWYLPMYYLNDMKNNMYIYKHRHIIRYKYKLTNAYGNYNLYFNTKYVCCWSASNIKLCSVCVYVIIQISP